MVNIVLPSRSEGIPVCSVSGGKDSSALYCLCVQQYGQDFRPVFADTGNEHPVTLNYVRNLHLFAGGPVVEFVKADFSDRLRSRDREPTGNPFLDMALWKSRFPSTKAQFCTELLKLAPIREWSQSLPDTPMMLIGVRAEESARRAKLPESEFSSYFDCMVYRPLLCQAESVVWGILESAGIAPNPLYALGFSRVGCFPCIHPVKDQLARLPDWVWQKLEEWEGVVGRSWFPPGRIPGFEGVPSVQQIRGWCSTSRGGKQLDMFNPQVSGEVVDVPSCMATWGACE